MKGGRVGVWGGAGENGGWGVLLIFAAPQHFS